MRKFSLGATLLVTFCCLLVTAARAGSDWPTAGQDLTNSRNQPDETTLTRFNVAGLAVKKQFAVAGDVTANPAIEGDSIYFGDTAGFLYSFGRDGTLKWKVSVSALTGAPNDYVRATPAIAGNLLIVGNQAGKSLAFLYDPTHQTPYPTGAKVFAVDKKSGARVWLTQVDATPFSMVTHSPIVANGLAIVGVASNEELIAGFIPQPYWQWQFRGSVLALDVKTGVVKWQTYTAPQGYFGASVWGSTGAADLNRNQVYMATGDNFWAPQAVFDCLNAGGSPAACLSPDDHFDSIIALDLSTGHVNWAQRGIPYDVWNVGCGLNVPGLVVSPNSNCPNPKGPDYDFAQGPILMTDGHDHDRGWGDNDDDIVGAGQKSGMFWAFKAKSGKLAWSTQAVPGGLTGGMQWGSAYDGHRIYVAASNANGAPWALLGGGTTTSGGWAALDPKNGKTLWTTQDPLGGRAEGAVSVANGVVYGCSLDATGHYYALDASTGAVKWSRPSSVPCSAGPSISNGMVFWGTGTGRGLGANVVNELSLP